LDPSFSDSTLLELFLNLVISAESKIIFSSKSRQRALYLKDS